MFLNVCLTHISHFHYISRKLTMAFQEVVWNKYGFRKTLPAQQLHRRVPKTLLWWQAFVYTHWENVNISGKTTSVQDYSSLKCFLIDIGMHWPVSKTFSIQGLTEFLVRFIDCLYNWRDLKTKQILQYKITYFINNMYLVMQSKLPCIVYTFRTRLSQYIFCIENVFIEFYWDIHIWISHNYFLQ